MSFDWQTEEDNDWDDQTWQEQPETAVSPKPPWRTILLILVLIAVAGVIIYRQVNTRLDEATSAVEMDIFATHNLLGRAASNQDGDLGKAVLSGRDLGWSQSQTKLLAAGLFYENPTFGLALADPEMAYAPLFREDERFIGLALDPNLNGAELSYARDYLAFTPKGVQTVTLQQTAVYRRGETRWLLAPPEPEFWGEWVTEEVDNLTYIYPARDAVILERLTADLTDHLAEICDQMPELECETAVQLRFDTNPESMLEAADPANIYLANLRLNVPTPTLVGLPINNDGYEALLYAYETKLLSALIAESVSYTCCSRAPLFQALMLYQLSEMGLAEWPVNPQTQHDLATTGVHTELLFRYWGSADFADLNSEDSVQLFGFVDFLLKQHVPQQTALGLMEQVKSVRTFQSWLVRLRNETGTESFDEGNLLSRDWWFYALTQSEITAVSQQPISLPAQDLQVGCMAFGDSLDNSATDTTLFRYSLDNDAWTEELTYNGLAFFNPLPKDNGVVLQLVEFSETQFWQTLLWKEGQSTEVMNLDDIYSISLGQVDPNGRFLLSYFGTEEQEALPEPLLIDMQSCQTGNCDSTAIAETPYWSPDSQWMLLTESHLFQSSQYMVDGRIITLNPGNVNPDGPLWLRQTFAEPETAVPVGQGIAPFWLDAEHFGYIRTAPQTDRPFDQELVIALINNLDPEVVLTTDVLTEALPERRVNNPLIMQYAIAHPTDPNILVVMAATQASDGFLFQFNRQTGQATTLFPLDISRGEHSMGFSPDGRFLVATGAFWQDSSQRQENMLFGVMHLYDLETGKHQPILLNTEVFFPAFTFDWSQDGNWLAFTRDNNVIGLLAPAYDYQQTIFHDQGNCVSLAWINPMADD
ncbi:MAG: PD40 domain-containing protein [Anaerolineales bacterium]|nr:PD40 domain-containing protein [Anaerolineales bacterium]